MLGDVWQRLSACEFEAALPHLPLVLPLICLAHFLAGSSILGSPWRLDWAQDWIILAVHRAVASASHCEIGCPGSLPPFLPGVPALLHVSSCCEPL